MKKRIVLCVLLGLLMAALTGCSADKVKETFAKAESDEEKEDEEEDEEEERDSKKKSKKSKKSEEDVNEEDAKDEEDADEEEDDEDVKDEEDKKDSKKKSKKNAGGIVLGSDEAEGYDGFNYLYEEILMTDTEENKETGKKERKSLIVFIPDDEYSTASGNYAYANSMGVNFRVELEPYLRYDAEDYLPEENLEAYMESSYDPFYTTDYKDMVVSDVEAIDNGAARCTVEYCEYDKWDEVYHTIFTTYYLTELENGYTVLVEVEVDDAEVTGKTSNLLDELSQFYQFEIDWDADRAKQKREAYAANETENRYSTGNVLFDLPLNWKEDTDLSDYENMVFAPEGDTEFSGCMISVYNEYMSYDEELDLEALVEEGGKAELEEGMSATVTEYNAEIVETGLGEAAKISYSIKDNDYKATGEMYFLSINGYAYTIQALMTEDAVEDPFIVLDGILSTATVREW